jgi:hypothetical protein
VDSDVEATSQKCIFVIGASFRQGSHRHNLVVSVPAFEMRAEIASENSSMSLQVLGNRVITEVLLKGMSRENSSP